MKLELKHICKRFPDGCPIRDMNAVINDGDIVGIIGPSGTGKSTLLRCINLLDPPSSGRILLDGADITDPFANREQLRQRIGTVFQSYNLFNHITAVENVMLALIRIRRLSKKEAYRIAMQQLELVGMAEAALKYPDELSGGQRQRVSIARTLAMDPELILLDEPTSALDPNLSREMEGVIRKLSKKGKTMIIVTHELRFAAAVCNRIFFLDKGIIYEQGTPEQIFEHPSRERTRAFVHHLKVYRYHFRTGRFSYRDYQEGFLAFIEKEGVDLQVQEKFHSIAEDIFTGLLPKYMQDDFSITLLCEYGKEENRLELVMYYDSPREGIIEDFEHFLGSRLADLRSEPSEDESFSRKILGKVSC